MLDGGVLVDFGLLMETSEASSGHGLGDGTLEYSALETELQRGGVCGLRYSRYSRALPRRSLAGVCSGRRCVQDLCIAECY